MDMRFELRRQTAHICIGLVIMAVYSNFNISPWYLVGLAIVSELGFFVNTKLKLPFVDWLVDKFERHGVKEEFPGKGFFMFLVGAGLSLMLFPRDIALAGIAVLTFGDAMANLVGKGIGNMKHIFNKRKTIEGSLAGLVAGFLGAMLCVAPLEALIAAFVGMVLEVLELRFGWLEFEDNLIIPISSGLALHILRFVF